MDVDQEIKLALQPDTAPTVSSTVQPGSKRAASPDDKERKRICGPDFGGGDDVKERIETILATLGDSSRVNIVDAIRDANEKIGEHIDVQEALIIDVFMRCITFKPEKLTIYSTLAGLVNIDFSQFGEMLLDRIVLDLNRYLVEGEFDFALRIITFIADLANTGVVTLDTVSDFLKLFLQGLAADENLQTDFFVYCVLHTLPWIGLNFYQNKADALAELLTPIDAYISRRKKHHLKTLQVWTEGSRQEQIDYIDSLWIQIKNLHNDDWNEQHIVRVDLAFKDQWAAGVKHDLPTVEVPAYSTDTPYPLPRVVFRLFDQADVVDDENTLPPADSIERFLVEEDLNWIISNNYLNWRICSRELLNYFRRDTIPLANCIIEVVFSQLFRLPEAPYLELFYGSLLTDLCRQDPDNIIPVLAHATQTLYMRTPHMSFICIERFVNWFSYHLSNFEFRWSWDDWADCINLDELSPKYIFVREVLEKCMRFSFHSRIAEIVPPDFGDLIPEPPIFTFVLDEPDHPNHEDAVMFINKLKNRAMPEEILLAVKRAEGEENEDDCPYDPFLVAVFTGSLMKVASQTISHTMSAFVRYKKTFLEFVKYGDVLQPVLLRTIYDCWLHHRQLLIIIIDSLLKMEVLDPQIIVAWIFSGELKDEIQRSWVWNLLNLAVTRAGKQYSVIRDARDEAEKVYLNKKAKVDNKKPEEKVAEGEELEDTVMEEENTEANRKLAALADALAEANVEYERAATDLKNLILNVCHKFVLSITEYLYKAEEEGTPFNTPTYRLLVGRFKETLILHYREVFAHWNDIQKELLASAGVDERIYDIFVQFRALKY